jgi:hypothetical protein
MSLITNGLQKRNSSVLNTQTKAEETSMRQRQKQKPDVNTIEKYFLLCKSCFWCVSYIGSTARVDISHDDEYTNCPVCKTGRIDSLSILQD